jgi:hypothetical protein
MSLRKLKKYRETLSRPMPWDDDLKCWQASDAVFKKLEKVNSEIKRREEAFSNDLRFTIRGVVIIIIATTVITLATLLYKNIYPDEQNKKKQQESHSNNKSIQYQNVTSHKEEKLKSRMK